MRFSLIALAGGITLLAACSSTPPMTAHNDAVHASPKVVADTPKTVQGNPVDQAKLEMERQAARLHQQMSDLNNKNVLFAFDDYSVPSTYTDMLAQQAQFLKAQPTDRLTLQGNSDERGGIEYNLALGQKRADAVRKALVLLGAPNDRIEDISFGEEKPRATCHEESCWAQNRRVDFVHQDKR